MNGLDRDEILVERLVIYMSYTFINKKVKKHGRRHIPYGYEILHKMKGGRQHILLEAQLLRVSLLGSALNLQPDLLF
jgi:hypothetical protein